MKSAIAALALGAVGSNAFVTPNAVVGRVASRSARQVSMASDPEVSIALPFTPRPENLTGELVGDVGFDPLNFSEEGDLAKYRRAELKHGRVAMLGVVGAIWQEFNVLPGLGYTPTKNLFQAVADAPWLAVLQVVVFVGIFDLQSTKYDIEQGRVPGDIGFDPLKLSKDGINEKWALSELKHGRLAMWAMAAILVQQLLVPDKSPLELTYEWSNQFH
ncbi:unnamed protein product [Ectocarpus sp. 12 AP-2014]